MTAISLRDYQDQSIAGLRDNIRRGIKNQILLAPTGAGKTVLASYLLNEAYSKLKRCLFICDRISLVNQTSAMLDFYGIPHGVIQGQHWRNKPWERIQVASAATLAKRGFPENLDMVIVDECHAQVKAVIDFIKKRTVICIGLTATPFSKALGKYYDAVVSVTTTNKLIRDKFLVPFRIFSASEPNMEGVKLKMGEWSEDGAAERSMSIVGDCVKEYLKHGNGKKFLTFACNVAHAAELKKQFMENGVICELYTYKEGDEFRTEIVEEFRKSDSYIRGLISVSALSKGFDVSDVEVVIMARPLKKSLSEHIQIFGRGLRIHDGKEYCLILDHAGNCMRFWNEMSDLFENGEVVLDMGEKKPEAKQKDPKEKTAKKCPICHHIHECAACPSCGHVPVKASGITHENGELSEMGVSAAISKEEKQDFYSQLLGLAEQTNRKSGWAFYKYKEKFGLEPSGLKKVSKLPSVKTQKWVQSRVIAYHNATKAAA